MKNTYSIPITRAISCDTLVIGGGLSGTAAAIASARGGLDTVLVEAGGNLGGQAGIGLVTPMSSLNDANGASFGGLAEEMRREIYENTLKLARGAREDGPHYRVSPHVTRLVLLKMAHDSGVRLHFHTTLIDAETENNRLTHVILHDKSGFLKISAKYFIDGSGDADLVYLSGDDWVLGSEAGVYDQLTEKKLDNVHESTLSCRYSDEGLMQPVSLFFTMRGVDYEAAAALNNKPLHFGDLGITRERFEAWEYANTEGFEITSDKIPTPQGRILVSRGRHADEAVINMSRIVDINGADADSLSDGEVRAQLQIPAIVDFLKNFVPAFKDAYLSEVSGRLGVRESRRLRGKYILSGRELIECRKFEDVICRGLYIVDIHDPRGKNMAIGGTIEGPYFEIPYGALCSAKYENLMAVGRCVSCDHVAASAVRIQGTCILTGQAAGCACVAAQRTGCAPCSLPYDALRVALLAGNITL